MERREIEIKKWLDKIEKEANHLGIEYFLAIVSNSNNKLQIRSNIPSNNLDIDDYKKFLTKSEEPFRSITFKDLYDYIQKAERNEYGNHFPFDNNQYAFAIYDGSRQVNVGIMKDGCHWSMCNFVFYAEEGLVKIAKVDLDKQIAAYSNMIELDWNESLNNEDWIQYVGKTWLFVKGLICDALDPFLAKQEVSE